MSARAPRPTSYLTRLLAELDEIHADYAEVLSELAIRNIDPGPGFIGFPSWGWAESSAETRSVAYGAAPACPRLEPRFRLWRRDKPFTRSR